MQVKKNLIKLDANIDEILAKLGIILGIAGAVLSALSYGSLIILGLSTSFICFSYLYIKRKKPEETAITSNRVLYILLILFFFLLSSSLLILYCSEPYTIPISFYIVISVLYAIIAAEIFFINKKSKLQYFPLLQILIVSLLFRVVIYFQFPSIVGMDPWYNHLMFNDIISRGYFSLEYMYSRFPIFPFENVESILVTGLEYKLCLFFTIGIIELLSIVFVFLLGKTICNFKTGVLASLFLSFYSAHIAYGTHSIIAMSVGITFFSIICYLIIKNHIKKSLKISIIIFLFLILLILTHVVAAAICFLLLLSFLFGKYLYKFIENKQMDERTVTFALASFFGVAMLGYWMWVSGYIGYIAESIKFVFDFSQREFVMGHVYRGSVDFYQSLFENLEYNIILLLLVLSVLVWLNKKNRTLERYYLLSFVGLTYLVIYVARRTGIDAMLPNRWYPFLYLLMSIFICFSLLELSTKLKRSGKIITTSIIFILSFTMIISNLANVDAPLYTSTDRTAFEESEMNSADFIYTRSNETSYTDVYYPQYFKSVLKKDVDMYNISYFGNGTIETNGIFILRDYTLTNYFRVIEEFKKQVGYSTATLIKGEKFNMNIFDEANKIYDCNSVYVYKK